MNTDEPFVHLFFVHGKYYMYDVNKNTILEISNRIYNLLYNNSNIKSEEDNKVINTLVKDGFISNNKVKEIRHAEDSYLSYLYECKLHAISLQVTQQCNLRCQYCSFSGSYKHREHSNKSMGLDVAKKAIDFLINRSSESRELRVGFYGGEPLLEFDMIKECVKYAGEMADGKKISFGMTSNATLINEKVIEFFVETDLDLIISLDGPRQIHDVNRRFAFNNCGTFDKVMKNIQQIKNSYPEYFLKKVKFNAVIDPQNDFKCTSEFFTNDEEVKDLYTMSSIITDVYSKEPKSYSEDFEIKMNYEIFKVLLHRLRRLNVRYISKISRTYFNDYTKLNERLMPTEKLNDKYHHGGPCIPGIQRLFIDTNGNLFPCERVSEKSEVMKIGNLDKGFDLDRVKKILNIGKLTEEKCKNCWAIRHCSLCAAHADNIDDFSADLKGSQCERVRKSTESLFKDYCALKELGYDFENDKNLIRL
jgi:uncharacterized protein